MTSRKRYEFDLLHRVVEELNRYIDERIRQEEEAVDALHPDDPGWKDKKIFYQESVHAFHSIEQHLLRLLEKQKEMNRLMKAYKHPMKVNG